MSGMAVGGESDWDLCRISGGKMSDVVCKVVVAIKPSSMHLQKIKRPLGRCHKSRVESLKLRSRR